MTPLTSILAATDFSRHGRYAVQRAALLARAHGARLEIVHALGTDGARALKHWFGAAGDAEQAGHALQRMAHDIARTHGVTAHVRVIASDPFEVLLQASQRAGMLVLGRRAPGRLEGLLAGPTADRLLGACARPVLVVKTPARAPYRRLLVPVDFSGSSDAAVRLAARVAGEASMQLFHAIGSPRSAGGLADDAAGRTIDATRMHAEGSTTARMRRRMARLGVDGTRMGFAVTHGPVVHATLRQALDLDADLIVAGRRGPPAARRGWPDSVSRGVLSGAACDVLIVPRPDDASRANVRWLGARPVVATARPGAAAIARGAAAFASLPPPPPAIATTVWPARSAR